MINLEHLAEIAARATNFVTTSTDTSPSGAKQRELNKHHRIEPQPPPNDRDPKPIVAVYAFKGGVGKTTICVHTAHYFALRGYKTLIADFDPQATASAYHKLPLQEQQQKASISAQYLIGRETSLQPAIATTQFPNVDIIPADLRLHDSDIALAIDVARGSSNNLVRMKKGLQAVSKHYDIVFIDGPPALASIGLAILASANCLFVPMRPSIPDCASTAHLLTLIHQYATTQTLPFGPYQLIKVLTNGGNTNEHSTDSILRTALQEVFQDAMCQHYLVQSAEIVATGSAFTSVYELGQAARNQRTYDRCLHHLNTLYNELEQHIDSAYE